MVALPESARALLADRAYAHLATRNPSGTPQLSMVWIDGDGDELLLNTAEGRAKVRNMRDDPHALISVQQRDDEQMYLLIHGLVTEITTDGADAHIDKLAKRFLDADTYPYRSADEQRLLVRIAVERFGGMGEWAPMPGYTPE